jgi:crotonobetainyl-CoA:carnitine CoA-transferase CaiB-like acyl-CoA transferase
MSGPLSGLRLLDLTHYAVGPWACALLGQMGADVIKVEPPDGDYLSRNPPPYKNSITAVYIAMNLNKRCAMLDMHDEVLRETMFELVRQSDILIENHRPGYLDRRGLSYEAVSKINPRLVYCSASGYGSRGPYMQMGSVDTYGQAVSGYASVSGAIGERPEGMKGSAPIDLTTSQYIVSGVLAALYNRELTGVGQFVDTSQMAAAAALTTPRAAEYFVSNVSPVPMGTGVGNIVPSRAFCGSDGRNFNVSALDEPVWQRLCRALGLNALARDPRLQSNAGRVAYRDEVDAALETVLSTQPAEHWIALFLAQEIPAGDYLTHNNLRIHEQIREQRMLQDVNTPWGRITVGGLPWRFSRTPGEIRPTHIPGADSQEILARFTPRAAAQAEAVERRQTALGPLEGLRVVDLTQGYVGFCGMTMADLGATVVKVEPPEGDYLRHLGPPFAAGNAAAFLGANRGKQSVRLAWETDPASREALDRLIAQADVLISDLQPTAARERRLDYGGSLAAAYPNLVLCSLTPFGDSGPIANQPATELEIQGISAIWRYFGDPGQQPVRMGIPIGAANASIFAFQGIMAALIERASSGRGQKVEVSQLGSQLAMQTVMFASESEPDEWIGHCIAHLKPPARGYAAADYSLLWGFMQDTAAYRKFCEWLGIPEVADEPPADWVRMAQLQSIFEKAFATHSAQELVDKVRELGGNAVQYHTFATFSRDPQAIATGLVREYDYPGIGKIGTTGLAWEFSNSPVALGRPPLLGEHDDEVLSAIGMTQQQRADIKRTAVP